jgi:uncharacterized repeat protein (TIGR02543 family)
MKRRTILALLLTVVMLFPVPVFADAGGETGGTADVEWTPEDFTYTEYQQRLYGCDYSRDLTVKGTAISGFSESGEEKLKTNTDLVLPSETPEGETVVGVAQSAFEGKGLTSVEFPTGMLIPYDDELTNIVTRRGNFIIAERAFANNELTSVDLPEGVIAVMSGGFMGNKLQTVKLPRTIWWLETQSFANNQITTVRFPNTTNFQFEMHGMAFAKNKIKSVRLPDFTAVVNKHTFVYNPGMEKIPEEAKSELNDDVYNNSGVVYMYTDNPDLKNLDRIHTIDKTTSSTKSWFQKLIVNDGSSETQDPDETAWKASDFTYDGKTVTGLSESGKAKRKVNKDLVIPDRNEKGKWITAIADAPAQSGGLFATADEKFDSVTLPDALEKVGNNAFRDAGLKQVNFSNKVQEIGTSAFMMNDLKTIVLPDSVTRLGAGCFSTNPNLRKIDLSENLTEIPAAAFGCSDNKNWMADLKSIKIPAKVTKIGARAFAGNNFTKIDVPEGVAEIGDYAFATKNYLLKDAPECEVTLHEGLQKIGKYAFRNKKVASIDLPKSVTALPKTVFAKEVTSESGTTETYDLVTKVYVSSAAQYNDKTNFPDSEFHKLYLMDSSTWTADDFTYDDIELDGSNSPYPASKTDDKLEGKIHVVTGFSETGAEKIEKNKDLVIPAKDPDGKKVQGVGKNAFKSVGISSVSFPDGVETDNNGKWDTSVTERGDFFIEYGSFMGNEIKDLELPEGVLYIGGMAFKGNKIENVSFPSTLMMIGSGAFAQNAITAPVFPKKTDFPLNIDNMAFMGNNIKSVSLPEKTEKVTKWAFIMNTGMEPVTNGTTTAEKKSGIVYMYIKDPGSYVEDVSNGKSKVQKLISGEIPDTESPWNISDFTYNETGNVVTGLSEAGKDKIKVNPHLVIPDKGPNGVTVTAIGNGTIGTSTDANEVGTFGIREKDGENTNIYVPESVKLPSGLKSIGDNAFSSFIESDGTMHGLTSVELPDGLTTIGSCAFQNEPLTSVVLPDSVTTIGNGAFANTEKLKSVVFSDQLTEIPSSAFIKANDDVTDKAVIAEVVIPDSVTNIGMNAFNGCSIGRVQLPEGLDSIGRMAFANNQLTSLTIPSSVTSIGSSAFAVTQETLDGKLSSLTFKAGFNGKISGNAFGKCRLTSAELPASMDNLKKIAFNAFTGAPAKVELRTSNTTLSETYASLTEVMKNKYTYTIVYDDMVGSGWSADDFTYSDDGTAVTGLTEKGIAKRNDGNHDLIIPDKSPSGKDITEIGADAFAFKESEIDVGKYDFNNPNGFETVVLPKNLKKIGDKAFEYNQLKEVDLEAEPELTSIGESAFHGNKLTKVYIPDTVNDLGGGAFSANSITDLRLSRNVTKIPQGAFSMNIRMSKVEIPDTVTEIGDMAFAGARLTSLDIPASVKKIGRKAFHLHHIEELTIPGTVKEIGDNAFEGTYKAQTLTKLKLGEGIESIGAGAFKEGLLTEVRLPSSLKTMGSEPFENNTGTGSGHVVILRTSNTDHLRFNVGAKTHRVISDEPAVMLDANGGTVETPYAVLRSNGTVGKLPTPAAESDKYTFDGWYTAKDGGSKVTTATRLSNGDTLYAHWSKVNIWTESDFTYDGQKVTGFSDEGLEKLKDDTDVVIPDKHDGKDITEIGSGAFSAKNITSVKLPARLETIGQAAFSGTKLKNVDLPDSVRTIGRMAFSGAPLEKLTLPAGLTEIGDSAFANSLITKIDIPAGVKKIGRYAFKCKKPEGGNLSRVTLNEGLEEIGKEAFAGQHIEKINIPSSLKVVDYSAFNKNTISGSDAKVRLISSVKDQSEAKGDYTGIDVANPKATFTLEYQEPYTPPQPGTGDSDTKTKNSWTFTLHMDSWTEGETESEPSAQASYGKVTYKYYDADKNELSGKPHSPGTYYVRAFVAGDDSHYALESDFVEFKITAAEYPDEVKKPARPFTVKCRASTASVEKLSWSKVSGASGYDVYFAKCGRKFKKVRTIRPNGRKTVSYKRKGLKRGRTYKFRIRAFKRVDGRKVYVKSTPTMHIIAGGSNGRFTDARKITASRRTLTLRTGKSRTVGAKLTKVRSGRKYLNHTAVRRYISGNKHVARVDSKGRITAVSKGTCIVRVFAPNGVYSDITVRVK